MECLELPLGVVNLGHPLSNTTQLIESHVLDFDLYFDIYSTPKPTALEL